MARKILKKGGRLVFLEPVRRDSYEGLKKDYAEGYTLIDFRE